ncbi:MAG: MFS transporter [Gammaproteobacteria bacterium]|jgi:MFS family permease|nr:MFS transporter [Gammaproteobacteria bacterium]
MWAVGLIYGTVRWLEVLAVAVFVFELTDSPFIVSLMLVLRMSPMIFFGGLIGVLAEKINRRQLLLIGFWGVATSCAVLSLLVLTDEIELWHIGLGAFLNGMIWSADYAVRRTLLGDIAGNNNVGVAMSLDSATTNVTRMLGPLLGGVIYAAIGLQGTYLVGLVLFSSAIYFIQTMTYRPGPALAMGSKFFTDLREGLRYIRSNRVITMVLTVTVVLNFFGFPFVAMVPVIGNEELGLNPVFIGMLASAEGGGAFVGAIFATLFAQPGHYRRLFVYGATIFLCGILVFSFSSGFTVSLVVLLIGGLGVAGFSTMQATIMYLEAPPEMRSRILGVLAFCIGASPIGLLNVGWLAEWLGPSTAVAVLASGGLLVMGWVFYYWRDVNH